MNEKESIFEYAGWFEEIFDVKLNKLLGTRKCDEQPGRKIGYDGEKEIIITQTITIQRGHKEIEVTASEKSPRRLRTRYLPLCGRVKGSR